MKVEFHGVDDSNGPIGVYLTAEPKHADDTDDVMLLSMLLRTIGDNKDGSNIFACLSDDTSGQVRVINGVLDIFPGGQA
jgi:hypothetical protein